MYSTCLFCNGSLGSNETLEHFPVGRRLAYDEAKGRLWVVCTSCERWNLSPIETRWEAIEEAERAFRGTKLRVSTDNIALAQLKDGTELVRIGKPPRTEFAAWRYGDQFGRRWRKFAIGTVAATLGPYGQATVQLLNFTNAIVLHGNGGRGMTSTMLVSVGIAAAGFVARSSRKKTDRRTIAAVQNDAGESLRVSRLLMDESTLVKPKRGTGFELVLSHFSDEESSPRPAWADRKKGVVPTKTTIIRGDAAMRALSVMLPHVNRLGGTPGTVRSAVDVITESNHVADILHRARPQARAVKYYGANPNHISMARIPGALRLAAEMTLHESDEHRAMEGELHELERRWKEADAIAKISDDMFLPDIRTRETG